MVRTSSLLATQVRAIDEVLSNREDACDVRVPSGRVDDMSVGSLARTQLSAAKHRSRHCAAERRPWERLTLEDPVDTERRRAREANAGEQPPAPSWLTGPTCRVSGGPETRASRRVGCSSPHVSG